MRSAHFLAVGALALAAQGCAGSAFTPVYPSRPSELPLEAMADPAPSRVVVHATATATALRDALEAAIPRAGEGTFPLLRSTRRFVWKRSDFTLRFDRGRLLITTRAVANADLPIGSLDLPLDLTIAAEPVIGSEYVARLSSIEVRVASDDRVVKVADAVAGILETVRRDLDARAQAFSYDLRPALTEAVARLGRPLELPLGDARGCASLRILGIEAGPTVLADGLEKDLALVILPQVTIPCAPQASGGELPPLANVAGVPSGPFTVSIPIAARYDELAKAMSLAFTGGKLYFSKEHPELYLEKPEVFAGKDQLVLKLRIRGPIRKFGITTTLDGDLYLTGHPVVVDNELQIPDLEPTIETSSFLLKLKDLFDRDSIRDPARAALRLDIGERLQAARSKLSADLAFGEGQGCMKAEVHKVLVTGVHAHAHYLRMHVDVTASARALVPCAPSAPTVLP
jgi:hypothetical protein